MLSPRQQARASRRSIAAGQTRPRSSSRALTEKNAPRIDRPKEAAIRSADLLGYLKSEFAALKPYAASLRALLVDAQADPQTTEAFRTAMLKPRQSALRQILAASTADADLRDALAEAIDGAI
jgi:hypothetical protein